MAFGADKRGSSRAGSGPASRGAARSGRRDNDEAYWDRGSAGHAGFWQSHARVRIAAKVLALCVIPVLAFLAGSLAGWLNNTLGSLQSNDRPTVTAIKHQLVTPRPGAPVTILILGSDRRQPRGPGHVDSILLARLDPATHRMALLFIPRDLRAPIPGHGRQPIAAAYQTGGPLLTLETVKGLTGLPINHFLDVDFQAFIDIVNALGGVHSTVPPGLGSPPVQAGPRLPCSRATTCSTGASSCPMCASRRTSTGARAGWQGRARSSPSCADSSRHRWTGTIP